LEDYATLGIPEYWIADYAAIGGIHYLGQPKQPTLSICTLAGPIYRVQRLQGDQPIVSPTFPHLNLTAAQVLRLQ
jgi:Uma2 family endonuclease